MDENIYKNYKLAGKIASESRNFGLDLIKPGVTFLEVANKVESKIKEKGGKIAFPVNISINEIAAHYCPLSGDEQVFKKGDVVKLDVGAHIDGYIADTAATVEVETNNYKDMIESSEKALEKAIENVKDGVDTSQIGKIVQDTITGYGFKPIDNLTGHSLEKYELHSGISVPNTPSIFNKEIIKEGVVLAIEPFSTNGQGHVSAGKGSNIYICNKSFRSKIIRDNRSKIIFNKLLTKFNTLPFAQRWCEEFLPKNSETALRRLSYLGFIKQYPQLIESKDSIVTQKEHTVIVKEDGCEVIT